MANPEQLAKLQEGVVAWDVWRLDNPEIDPDLSGADLDGADLSGADLSDAVLSRADLRTANLSCANLSGADLSDASLRYANLSRADLSDAVLSDAILSDAVLRGANLTRAALNKTVFSFMDLSTTQGLDTCRHFSRSALDTHTLTQSKGLPISFLRGCGLSDKAIEFLPSVFQDQALDYYSCFISYSTQDQAFAERLYNDLQGAGIRCWFAPEDIQGGKKTYDQIDDAIRVHDKLVLILSQDSITSDWVEIELRRGLKAEKQLGRQKLFPLRVVPYDTLEDWTCFDADLKKDLAAEVREYFIPDFSNWQHHPSYQEAFTRLLADLKGEGPPTTASTTT